VLGGLKVSAREVVIGLDARYGLRKSRRGIGNYIFNLVLELRRLAPEGWRFILYCDRQASREVLTELESGKLQVRSLWAPNAALWEQVVLPIAAMRDGVMLLHGTSNVAPVLLKRWKLVTTIHDVIEFRRHVFGDDRLTWQHRVSRSYRMSILPLVARLSDHIITVSNWSRADIVSVLRVHPRHVTVIYEAPPRRATLPGEQDAILDSLGIRPPYILALGAIDPRKNTRRLFDAYRLLQRTDDTLPQLVVVGIEQPRLIARDAPKGAVVLGFQPDEVLSVLYRCAHFFVYPSLYEGFGLAILEAMEKGVPVLCSSTTATGEIAGDAALLCDPYDCRDIAEKMLMLIRDSALREALAQGGARRVALFSWEQCARQTLDVYQDVLKITEGKNITLYR